MTKDQQIAALKAQVNALRDELINICASPNPVSYGEAKRMVKKTPQQCLAEYRNQVIDECIKELNETFRGGVYIDWLEELKESHK